MTRGRRLPLTQLAQLALCGALLLVPVTLAMVAGQEGAAEAAQGSEGQGPNPPPPPGASTAWKQQAKSGVSSQPTLTCEAHCPAPPPAPACRPRIPPGYEHFPGLGYYRLHLTPLAWYEAKATCETEGAHLAVLNSQAEADLMKSLFHRDLNIGKWIYLGFHDLYKEGKYVTLLGGLVSETGYNNWNPGQPDNNGNNENCGSMYPSGGLNDSNCVLKLPFVCEFPVNTI